MAKLSTELFVLCDHASVSQEQKLSIIGVFDQFFVANLPTTWPRMFLVAVLKGEPASEYSLKLKLIPPEKGQPEFPAKELNLRLGQNGKANLLTELVNFPLQHAGLYRFEILADNQKVGELGFKVNKTTATYGGQDLAGKKVSN